VEYEHKTEEMEMYYKAGIEELKKVYSGGNTFRFHTVMRAEKLMDEVFPRNEDNEIDVESEKEEDDVLHCQDQPANISQ
jgi:hypothetical protein